ncbi:MAG: dipeptidase [Alphaproteobacteria bacterium]|nr:dipeptidase [Alphaproteobacteria bacterium]
MRWLLGLLVVMVAVVGVGFVTGPGLLEGSLNRVERDALPVPGDEASALHATLDMVDLHADTLLWGRDVLVRGERGHVDVPRLVEGRYAVQVFSTVTKTPRGQNYDRNTGDTDSITLLALINAWPSRTWNSLTERAVFQAERLQQAARTSPGTIMLLLRKEDIRTLMKARAGGSSIVGGLLSTEGAHALEGRIENVQRLREAGYRMMGLTHFFDNEVGGSLHGVSKAGLSPFGFQVIRAMEEAGIIVDLAHASEKMVSDVLQVAMKPPVVSHTGVRGTCNSARNLSDDTMKAIAAKGGLIGIGYWKGAVCDDTPAGVAKAIRYAVDLVGEDHVALGSDYDGSTTVTFDTSESAVLVAAMLDAGLSAEQVRKVTGGNALRFLEANLPD